MNNSQLAATTGFLDRIELENETVWLGGWFLSFESEPVEKLKFSIGNVELKDFEITRHLPSPGVKKVHPNIPEADRCRFLVKLPMKPSQQQQFRDSLISLIPIIQGREGEPLLTAVNPSLSPLLKQSEPGEADNTQDASSTPQVELIYVHVPKAAGTAFRKILQQVYGPQRVLTDTTNMFEDNMPATIDWQTKVIDGHFRAGKYDQLFPETKTITWLRQPIHRLISDYCFRQMGSLKQKEFLSKEKLLEFAKIPGNRNLISYCINGKPLNYFYFVGIQEYFEEDLQDLRELLGWQEANAVYQNRNPYPEYNQFKKAVLADRKLMEELAALNGQDIRLYQAAWKLRDQRKKGLISLPLTPPAKTGETPPAKTGETPPAKTGETPPAKTGETRPAKTGGTPVLREAKTGVPPAPGERVPTLGSMDKVVVSDRFLEITGWVFSPKAGLPDSFQFTVGGLNIANLLPKVGLPSPDVKKIHPNSPNAGKARFRLQVSLSPEQIEKITDGRVGQVTGGQLVTDGTPKTGGTPVLRENLQISLIPIFQGRHGKPLVKALTVEQASRLLPPKQTSPPLPVEQISPPLPVVGYLDQVTIENQEAIAIGWVASLGGGPLTGFKLSIGGKDMEKFQETLGIPSPDVAKKRPNLDNSEAARFKLRIPLELNQVEEYDGLPLVLTPVFKGGVGAVMTKVLASGSGSLSETPVSEPVEQLSPLSETPVSEPVEQISPLSETPVSEPVEQAPRLLEAPATKPQQPSPPSTATTPTKRSPLFEKIKAQLERSQTEMQEVRADLEGSKTGKKQDPEKKTLTEKLATDDVTDVTDGFSQLTINNEQLTIGQKGDKSSPPLKRGAGGDPLPLLGLSGVTVEKFWELVDPVIEKGKNQRGATTTNPAISILTPTWNSSLDWFVETVLSVLHQTMPNWEWCLVDDGSKNPEIKTVLAGLAEKEPRIKVRFAESGGISAATNKALEMATGDYICCLDHDDTLTPTALEDSLDKLAEGFDVSYSDEDKIDLSGLNYIQPFFKPDWSPEYFRGVMYVGHLLCVLRHLALQVGGFKSEFDGVQDYEFMLRVSELTDKIAHIPKHLYHWRQVRGSISADADAKAGIETVQQAAVNAHLQRLGLPAKAEPGLGRHRANINPHPRSENPLVSLIVSSQNPDDRLGEWLNDLLSKTAYPNLEIMVVLTYEKTEQLPETIHNFPVKTVRLKDTKLPPSQGWQGEISLFSRANNFAAEEAAGEYLIFLKPGVRSITEDWLRHFLYYGEQNDVGAVGGLLLFADGTVEHAGIVVGEIAEAIATEQIAEEIGTNCDFVMRGFKSDADGYAGSLVCAREVSAVSKDCFMVKKSEFEGVGGFNEHLLSGYQEVDLCMRMRQENKRIILTPRSVLVNPHSTNLELENTDFLDKMLLLDSHQIEIEKGDPYHNPNLD